MKKLALLSCLLFSMTFDGCLDLCPACDIAIGGVQSFGVQQFGGVQTFAAPCGGVAVQQFAQPVAFQSFAVPTFGSALAVQSFSSFNSFNTFGGFNTFSVSPFAFHRRGFRSFGFGRRVPVFGPLGFRRGFVRF